jgi:hypothetical protein
MPSPGSFHGASSARRTSRRACSAWRRPATGAADIWKPGAGWHAYRRPPTTIHSRDTCGRRPSTRSVDPRRRPRRPPRWPPRSRCPPRRSRSPIALPSSSVTSSPRAAAISRRRRGSLVSSSRPPSSRRREGRPARISPPRPSGTARHGHTSDRRPRRAVRRSRTSLVDAGRTTTANCARRSTGSFAVSFPPRLAKRTAAAERRRLIAELVAGAHVAREAAARSALGRR